MATFEPILSVKSWQSGWNFLMEGVGWNPSYCQIALPPPVWTAWSARGTTRRLAALAGTIPRSLFMALLERPPPAASCLSSCLLSFSSFLISSLLFHFFFSLCAHSCFAFIAIAVSGPTEHCSIFHFPPFVRSSVRHRRDISTFLDNLMG